ncbi:hypothetical protein GF361_01140 [Candidatus Woesearchaeota archaeon]|nr:hypothetical protein [Candidatus Woesearchaeota archaeon]
MKILICCSKAFYEKIDFIKKELEEKGHSIILPNSYDNVGREQEMRELGRKEHADWKGQMFRESEEKIKETDALLVLNYEKNGKKNYLGGSTLLEMYDAFKLNKKIFMVNPVPENMLKDEILGLNPIIIENNLEMVK